MKIATVLTIRSGSERLPGKALLPVCGKPVSAWIVERLRAIPGKLIIATTTEKGDDEIEAFGKSVDVPVYRGSVNDVVGRINGAVLEHYPQAEFVFRGLGDCPFLETRFVERAAQVMVRQKAEAFVWQLAPDTWPVYGAREFPFARSAWNKIVEGAKQSEREHVDQYFHNNRGKFRIVYHEPPHSVYFRNYRLEIDWTDDLELVREIGKQVGMLAPLSDIIHYIDTHPDLANINRERIERTGPLTSYVYALRRSWMKAMTGKPVLHWDETIWQPPDSSNSTPIFCTRGTCMIGYGYEGILYTPRGDRIAGNAHLACACGAGRKWETAKQRK